MKFNRDTALLSAYSGKSFSYFESHFKVMKERNKDNTDSIKNDLKDFTRLGLITMSEQAKLLLKYT